METRKNIVTHLIEHQEPISRLVQKLKVYGWDCDEELVVLTPAHVVNVLDKYLANEINEMQVQEWANAIERREDIGFQEEYSSTLDEMIFWLASPNINFPISVELAQRVILNLNNNSVN